ncbi:MAG: DUF2723 domain-containing protein, partial [Mucilaginibacter polytrichastri]|nr:DUF2723 domain-containing protein [Mucilaginibacter polytrichastri]
SFYAFAIWIGLGVLAIADLLKRPLGQKNAAMLSGAVCLLAVPALMASQEWDDHDRSEKRVAHDMAVNYLQSCKPNAILFTYGDNDTYPLWYVQEVENVRPDIRIVNLSLLGTDWYIRGMKQKMNESAPLPITMANEKFEAGVRDILPFSDAGIKGSVNVKEVFDFMLSDSQDAKVQYEDGSTSNYLPTKNLRIPVNADEVIRNGIVGEDQRGKIDSAVTWTYGGNYVTKDNLAMLDILAHNNWKRPVYFAVTVGSSNMIGLQNYLYNEGFAYELMPLKNDTTVQALERTNTQLMYSNVMNKFQWGNFKHANYLDHESTTMFYPVVIRWMNTLAENLLAEGKEQEARNILKKYIDEMPDIYPYMDVAVRKFYMADTLYKLNMQKEANDVVDKVGDYLSDQLDYFARENEKHPDSSPREVQLGMSLMNELVKLTADQKQTALNKKLDTSFKGFQKRFGLYQ